MKGLGQGSTILQEANASYLLKQKIRQISIYQSIDYME